MQNDFISGSLGSGIAEKIIPNVIKVIENFKSKNADIITTMDFHKKENYLDTLEGKRVPEHCIHQTDGFYLHTKIQDSLSGYEKHFKLTKRIFGINWFDNSIFPNYSAYENIEYDKITIIGLCTDICVVSNALILRSAFPNTPIECIIDSCAGTSIINHVAALTVMKNCLIDIV